MRAITVSDAAQLALVKLLIKLKLIGDEAAGEMFQVGDTCPLAFFGGVGRIDEIAAMRAVAEHLGIPVFLFDKAQGESIVGLLDNKKIAKIPAARWKELRIVPIELRGSTLVAGMANPLDFESKKAIEFDLGCKLEIGIAQEIQITALLSRSFVTSEAFDLKAILAESEGEGKTSKRPSLERFESSVFSGDVAAAPVVRLANKILSDAVAQDASDIHLNPESDQMVVRIRVDGMMRTLFTIPSNIQQAVVSRIKLLCGMDIAEHRKPQDGRLRIETANGLKDLRISAIPTAYGENLVARVLSSDFSKISIDALGMPLRVEEAYQRALRGSSRVVLVTGPTGSGKTSTTYAGLLYLRDGKSNIITVEDPIEYRIQGINQVQVNAKIGMTFAGSLRSILRQDPDIVMVGEVRDAETATIAMQAAQTGHLVLSTIHTNSAAAVMTRLGDLGVPPYIIASSLAAVVAQRLARKLCSCAVAAHDDTLARCDELGIDPKNARDAKGCQACGDTGYLGRTGIYSLLEVTDSVRDAIRDQMGERVIEARAVASGFRSLEQAGADLVRDGITSLEEIERVVGLLSAASLRAPEESSVKGAGAAVISAPVQEKSAGTAVPGAPLRKRRVLLVEDDPDTRAVLSMILQGAFFEVSEASDGVEGLERVYECAPEIILCDLMMPKMSGLQLVTKLRSDARTRAIPVLMLTAADSQENELQLISSGADDFLSKVTDPKIMVARIERLLDRVQPVR